jgi:hypothetical protein
MKTNVKIMVKNITIKNASTKSNTAVRFARSNP